MTSHAIGQLFIVAAPSGGGKTSLVQGLVKTIPNIEISVSHTTRDQRPGEVEGVHYFFISHDKFERMVHNQEFVEHALVYGQHYGTSRQQIQKRLDQGIDVVLDIDWQGAQQLKTLFKNAISIFILPPSLDALKQRLTERARDKEAVIRERMTKARDEITHYDEFDYLIINEVFETALHELQAIVVGQRLRSSIQAKKHEQLLSLLIE
jgi:guanylate kinase